MTQHDRISGTNQRHWEWAVKKGAGCTVPWLDLDPNRLRQYARGETQALQEPLAGMYPASVLDGVEGKDVLCLASGGGQQSAVFALLGARVTVLDLTEAQLEGDRTAAGHYGYELTTIQADMRDISCLAQDSFDIVYQGNSMCWIPHVQQVYQGVARVLRPGGIYRVDFANPATEFVEPDSWSGEGYSISVPYVQKEMLLRPDPEGPDSIQFRHHMGDIFQGLLAVGLEIQQVQDSPQYFTGDPGAQPGTWRHWQRFVGGFAVVAGKP